MRHPWFRPIQGNARLQIAGLASPGNETVFRENSENSKLSVFCFDSDTLTAVQSVNRPGDHVAANEILDHGSGVTPEQCREPGFDP